MSDWTAWFGIGMFGAVFALLALGFPVGFTLIGTAVAFAGIGALFDVFDLSVLAALTNRLIGLMENDLLQAIPLFVYLGVILQRTSLAQELLEAMSGLFGRAPGGIAISTILLGALLAPTTGAVGATVLTLGMLALPAMLAAGYDRGLAAGIVCSAGTLGTIAPPSVILIVLADSMRGALASAESSGTSVVHSLVIKDIYLGTLTPVAIVVSCYLAYAIGVAMLRPARCPPPEHAVRLRWQRAIVVIGLPIGFLALLLASIVSARFYTVEAAALGALAATAYCMARGVLTVARLAETVQLVMRLTGMTFLLLIGASTFTLVFRGYRSDVLVGDLIHALPGGVGFAVASVFATVFLFGFFLDALEIVLLVVPIAMPPLLQLGADPVWLAVLMAVTVQTSFLIPPSGFALFFLRGVAPRELPTADMYRGVLPFIAIQVFVISLLWIFPALATWLSGPG